jgi:periplasmic protein TonB
MPTAICKLLYGICKLSHLIRNTAPVLILFFSLQNQPDMNKKFILKSDILDIIFEKRNKLYGAYDLRKFYPSRLKLALGFMLIAAAAFSAFTLMPEKKHVLTLITCPIADTKLIEIKPEPKVPEKKIQEALKPKTKTPTKHTPVAQKAFTNNLKIVDNNVKTDTIFTLKPKDNIGTTTIIITEPGPFLMQPTKTEPAGSGEKPTIIIDKTLPMNGNAVDVLPAYPGGMDALTKFLQKNLQNPGQMESGETISVRVKFVVDNTGKLKSFVTVLDGGELYNKEVIRVLKKMPDWIPGKTKGEDVSVYYVIPVKFTGAD